MRLATRNVLHVANSSSEGAQEMEPTDLGTALAHARSGVWKSSRPVHERNPLVRTRPPRKRKCACASPRGMRQAYDAIQSDAGTKLNETSKSANQSSVFNDNQVSHNPP